MAAELGIGDVEEIGAAGHGTQRRPGLDMGDRVVGVAVGGAKLDRHAAVGIGGQDEQQLLQIRAMVLRVTVSDRRRPLAGLAQPDGRGTDRRRLIEVLSLWSRFSCTAKRLATAKTTSVSNAARSASNKRSRARPKRSSLKLLSRVPAGDAEETRGEAVHGLLRTVDRLALDHDRAQQHAERLGVRHAAARIARRDVLLEERREAHPFDEVIDEGKRTQPLAC